MKKKQGKKNNWLVVVDTQKCSICEICAIHCPTSAIKLRRVDEFEEILFEYKLCDLCGGNAYCKEHCPEEAIRITEITNNSKLSNRILLIRGNLVKCQECGSFYMPQKKLEILLTKPGVNDKEILKVCPDCRRIHLLENYPTLVME